MDKDPSVELNDEIDHEYCSFTTSPVAKHEDAFPKAIISRASLALILREDCPTI
jgi:hypothetical protein